MTHLSSLRSYFWKLPLFIKNFTQHKFIFLLLFVLNTAGKNVLARRTPDTANNLALAAIERTKHTVRYDASYVAIPYPNGDVPKDTGVCTDVIIRSYRALGVDLQKLVHEDMSDNFMSYPSKRIWGLNSTDRNIDHRRVPNLQVFFKRHGRALAVTKNTNDYLAGDIVTWRVSGGLPHIGIVIDQNSLLTGNPLIVHNIGAGPKIEDMLFDFEMTGHYRYLT